MGELYVLIPLSTTVQQHGVGFMGTGKEGRGKESIQLAGWSEDAWQCKGRGPEHQNQN